MIPPINQEQLDNFNRDGYVVLRNVFNPDEINKYLKAVDSIIIKSQQEKDIKTSHGYHDKSYFNIHNPLSYTDVLDDLIDCEKFFNVITYLMGPFIQMMGLHVFVRGHCESNYQNNLMKFHTDSGPAIQRILPAPGNLPLQLKVQIYLTDVSQENAGNFTVVPGSHLKRVKNYSQYCLVDEYNTELEKGSMPKNAKQLCVKPGDISIHGLNVWHAVAPNFTNNIRKSIMLRYGQLWFRTYYSYINDEIINRLTKRQIRLLGIFENETRGDIYYRPPEDQINIMIGDKAKEYGWA